jgi:hypothetical protein
MEAFLPATGWGLLWSNFLSLARSLPLSVSLPLSSSRPLSLGLFPHNLPVRADAVAQNATIS